MWPPNFQGFLPSCMLTQPYLCQYWTMSNAASDILPRGAMNILKGMLWVLDPQEPNDMVFKMVSVVWLCCGPYFPQKKPFLWHLTHDSPLLIFQCIVHNMPVPDAMAYTNASGTRQAMHQRIGRWKNSLSPANLLLLQVAHGVVLLDDALEEPSRTTKLTLPNHSRTTKLTPPNPSHTTKFVTPANTRALDNIAPWCHRPEFYMI